MYQLVSFHSLDLFETSTQCVGNARTQGRRCYNPASGSHTTIARLTQKLSRAPDPLLVDDECLQLAEASLCNRWHRHGRNGQAEAVARHWSQEIHSRINARVNNSSVSAPAAPLPSVPMVASSGNASAHAAIAALIRQVQDRNTSLEADLLVARSELANTRQQTAEGSILHARISALETSRQSAETKIRRLTQENRTHEYEILELRDSGSVLREQIVDLSQSLDRARDQVAGGKERVVELEAEVVSERELRSAVEKREGELRAVNTKLEAEVASERELKDSAEQSEQVLRVLTSNLISQVSSERDMRRRTERGEQELQTQNTELLGRIENERSEVSRLVEQETETHEARMELEARQASWNEYNMSWTRFNVTVAQHKTRNPLTFFRKSSLSPGAIMQSIPWPTPTGAVEDVSSEVVQIFLINSVPGLMGVPDKAAVGLAVISLECEEARWQTLVPRSAVREATTSRCLEVVRTAVSDLLSDTKEQLRRMESGTEEAIQRLVESA